MKKQNNPKNINERPSQTSTTSQTTPKSQTNLNSQTAPKSQTNFNSRTNQNNQINKNHKTNKPSQNNHPQNLKRKPSNLLRLLSYARPHLFFLICSFLCAVLSVLLILYIPVLIGEIIDLMLGAGSVLFGSIAPLLLRLALCIVGSAVLTWLISCCNNIISYRTVEDLRCAMSNKINEAPLMFIDKQARGDMMNRMVYDIDMVADGLLQASTQLFSGFVTIGVTLGILFYLEVRVALVVLLMTPLSIFAAAFIAKGCHKHFTEQTKMQGSLSGITEESVAQGRLLQAFSAEETMQTLHDEVNEKLCVCGKKAHFFSALINPTTRLVNNLVYATVGIVGTALGLSYGISVGQISVFLIYANQYTKPFNEISTVLTQLQTAFASANRVFEVLDTPSETEIDTGENFNQIGVGNITFDHVSFSYVKDKPLIEDFNLTVKSGQRIAIVGETGCGKTTMINLLMRFYDPKGGRIIVDGVDHTKIPRAKLRQRFGMVLQDSWLFHGTVRENIAYGKQNATEEEIVKAAKEAYADSFIRQMEKGYDTMVTQGGRNLSAGQRQLLCIARVMLSDMPILILDEATSSIDTRTELRVQKAFANMMEGKTSFVIAHRLSTIQNADSILVMQNGHIVEQGNHATLYAQGGLYRELYQKSIASVETVSS